MILLSFQPHSLERNISKINNLDIFISETGNMWNTAISRVLQTGTIYFMQPVTILRILKEVYFIVSLRSCKICGDGTAYLVKIDYFINKFSEKEKEWRTMWSTSTGLKWGKNQLGKKKYSEVRRAGTKAEIMLPFHVLTILCFWKCDCENMK